MIKFIDPLSAFAAFLIVFPSFCQMSKTDSFNQSNLNSLGSGGRMFQSFDNRFKGVKGNVTLFEQYVPGKIFMSEGQVIYHNKVNYDAYNNELLVLKDGQEVVVSIKMVRYFILQDQDNEDSLIFTKLAMPDDKVGYYQVLANYKNATLYKKIYKVLQGPTYTGAYSTGQTHSELTLEHKLVMFGKGKQLQEFKTQKQLLQYFPEQKNEISHFIKDEKIDFKNEGELKKLFGFISNLIGS